MKSEFEIIRHDFEDKKDIIIYPIADVHLGDSHCQIKEFCKLINYIAETPNAYIMLLGDLINNSLRTSVANPFDEIMRPLDQKKFMTKFLEPVKDKILCAVGGNHEARSMKDSDTDITYDIMCKLNIEDRYRPNMAFVKIKFGGNHGHYDTDPCYVICVTHGCGGGMLTGGSVNRAENFAMAIDGIDAFVHGHTHKPYVTTPGKIVIDKIHNTIRVVPFKVLCATSWLDYGGYAAGKMLRPSAFALNYMILKGNRKEIQVVT